MIKTPRPNSKITIILDDAHFGGSATDELMKRIRAFAAEKGIDMTATSERLYAKDAQDKSTDHPEKYIKYTEKFAFSCERDSEHTDEDKVI